MIPFLTFILILSAGFTGALLIAEVLRKHGRAALAAALLTAFIIQVAGILGLPSLCREMRRGLEPQPTRLDLVLRGEN